VIFDHLSGADPYFCLGENFIAGFQYLRATAFDTVPDGRYRIRGDDVFATVQTYHTKPIEQGRWEAHRHYADIQYLIRGCEGIGMAHLDEMTVAEPYSRDHDVEFFIGHSRVQFIRVDRGSFAIFLPQDVHMPGLMFETPTQVRKVVVKVRI
jgi:YhcH/YjgK/YiaL family protein